MIQAIRDRLTRKGHRTKRCGMSVDAMEDRACGRRAVSLWTTGGSWIYLCRKHDSEARLVRLEKGGEA